MHCRGRRYDVRCNENDLSVTGRKFFKDILHIRENDLAGIAIEMEKLKDTPFEEKEPTTYLFRRNLATRMGNLRDDKNGLSLSDLQYLQSHGIEDIKTKFEQIFGNVYKSCYNVLMKKHSLDIANYSKNAAKNYSYTRLIIYAIISLLLTVSLIVAMLEYKYEDKAFLFNVVALVMIVGYLFLNIKAIIF